MASRRFRLIAPRRPRPIIRSESREPARWARSAGTATISSAVLDALAPLGVGHLDMPLTAEKIHNAIAAVSNGGGA